MGVANLKQWMEWWTKRYKVKKKKKTIQALRFMKETRQVQTGCCPNNCISTNIIYSKNKETKENWVDWERWGWLH